MDTDVLMAAFGYDEDRDLCERARPYLYREQPPYPCVSLPVLGEITLKLVDLTGERLEDAAFKLHKHIIGGKLQVRALGDKGAETLQLAAEIRKGDEMIGLTDALVIACMLEDHEAESLVSTDEFVSSTFLQAMARDRGKSLKELD